MRKAALFLAVMFLAMAVPFFGQATEHLTTTPSVGISFGANRPTTETLPVDESLLAWVGPGGALDEHIRLVKNEVTFTARHCQAYEKKKGWFKKRLVIDEKACAADPSTVFFTETKENLRTNAGGDWQASVMANTAAPPATANYIAVSNDATAPSTSDTTLASEITLNGLARAQGVYAHTGGTASYTVQKVFSATGTQASQKAGLFNASSSGTMVFENTYTQVTVNNGDTLTVTWTVNY